MLMCIMWRSITSQFGRVVAVNIIRGFPFCAPMDALMRKKSNKHPAARRAESDAPSKTRYDDSTTRSVPFARWHEARKHRANLIGGKAHSHGARVACSCVPRETHRRPCRSPRGSSLLPPPLEVHLAASQPASCAHHWEMYATRSRLSEPFAPEQRLRARTRALRSLSGRVELFWLVHLPCWQLQQTSETRRHGERIPPLSGALAA